MYSLLRGLIINFNKKAFYFIFYNLNNLSQYFNEVPFEKNEDKDKNEDQDLRSTRELSETMKQPTKPVKKLKKRQASKISDAIEQLYRIAQSASTKKTYD